MRPIARVAGGVRLRAMIGRTMTLTFVVAAFVAFAEPGAAATGAVRVTTSVEADMSRTMVHEVLVDASVADVWTEISTPQGWMNWAVPSAWISPTDPDILETSYDRTDVPGSPGTIQQRFVARIPGRLLAFRTIKAPTGFPHWETYRGVTSLFEIEPVGRQTRVQLTSTGYSDNDAGRALIAFFERGNAQTLESLQRRFVTGPVDWEKR